MSELIRFDNVYFRTDPFHGPRHWSFSVEEGSVSAAVASPAVSDGVVRLCVGEVRPAAGTLSVLGADPGTMGRIELYRFRRTLGVAFRRRALVDNVSLRDNLMLPLVFGGICSVGEAERKADEALEVLELGHWAEGRPDSIPNEVRTMGDIARAALPEPRILILGNPATALTREHARQIRDWCLSLCSTIFILSPDRIRPLADLADRWLVLGDTEEETAPTDPSAPVD